MPRPRRKETTEPVQGSPPTAPGADQLAQPVPPAPEEPDVFDQAIAARQQGQSGDHASEEAAAPALANTPERGEWQSKLPDPFDRHGIDLGDSRRARLFRNNKFQQNAIVFHAPEGEDPKPPEEARTFLKDHHWRWRPEVEGKPWTKQFLTPDDKADIEQIKADKGEQAARAERSRRRIAGDRQAEEEFVAMANLIRQQKGLEPVDYSFGQEVTR
jgi:hypothetical protein